MRKAPKGRIIRRKDAADIFYNDTKMKKFYNGKPPSSVTLMDVHNRLELVNKDGTRRRIQGRAVFK